MQNIHYIGRTAREVSKPYKERISARKEANNISNYTQHILNENHEYKNIDETMKILYISQKGTKMNLLESLYILRYKTKDPIINEQTDLEDHGTLKIFKQYLNV